MELDQQKTRRHVVTTVSELPPGERRIVRVSGREIGVFNIDGEFYALRNVCPHRGAPLCKGRLRPLITSASESTQTDLPEDEQPRELYGVAYGREGEILKCPWHLWEFDVKTGRSLHDADLRVRSYPVRQEGEQVVLYLE